MEGPPFQRGEKNKSPKETIHVGYSGTSLSMMWGGLYKMGFFDIMKAESENLLP